MDSKILEQLEEYFKGEFDLVQHDLGQLEEMIKQKMQLLGQGLLQRAVERSPNGYKGSSIGCQCGCTMRFVGHRSRHIHTIFGWIEIKRAYYHCADCGASVVPYDAASGLGSSQLSPGLAKACCLLAVDDSFAQVAQKIDSLMGQKVSSNTVEQVVHTAGAVAVKEQQQRLQEFTCHRQVPKPQVQPDRLYIAVDGTTAHQTDGWHEAKVGCIYWDDQRFKRNSRYVACFDSSEIFGWRVWLEACRCGLREAMEVVYLGDGAGWVRTEHERHFRRAVFIVDWFHACEHIWDCGKVLLGEGKEQTKRWVEKRKSLLWDGWTRKLLKDLNRQCKKYGGIKRKAIESLYHYILVNEEQMRYDVFRAKGYDIGSGAVEGACKYVIAKRLKQSGMIWTKHGSSAVLALRTTWLNSSWRSLPEHGDDWEQLWLKKPLAA